MFNSYTYVNNTPTNYNNCKKVIIVHTSFEIKHYCKIIILKI